MKELAKGLIFVSMGAFTFGFCAKLIHIYWLDLPNFIDGIVGFASGVTLVVLGCGTIRRLLRAQEERHGH